MDTELSTPALLPREALLRTGAVDHADWNYRPLLGWIQRQRFHLVLRLMGGRRFDRILEIGYGSGVFMPELRRHCEELYGIDKHALHEAVAQRLAQHGIAAQLFQASAERTPFRDRWFGAIVAISSLEYVEDLAAACTEFARILKPGGQLIVVTPGHSPVLDLGLKLMTGESAAENYGARRKALVPTLARHFRLETMLSSPRLGGPLMRLYRGLRLTYTGAEPT
jgi:ubiquinone/menaquinone biosynthesis C-methylase UbiE